jgi:EAL and modified HD-GYP domain-containing signal transduction protein
MWQALKARLGMQPRQASPARDAPRVEATPDHARDASRGAAGTTGHETTAASMHPAATPSMHPAATPPTQHAATPSEPSVHRASPPSAHEAATNATAIPSTIVGARRPLVDAAGALAGFEFHVAPSLIERLGRERAHPAAQAATASVLAAMRLSLAPGRVALAELPAGWLAAIGDDGDYRAGMWFVVGADADATLVARLHRLGAKVGWRAAQPPAGLAPDFLLVPAAQAMQPVGQRPRVPLLVLDAPTLEAMEALLRAPVALVACNPTAAPETAQAKVLSPQVQRLMSLLARLVRDDDHHAVVADIKADAALALRLLKYLNSAGASPGRVLISIDDAVRVLGRDALYRWCSQLLVRLGPSRPSASALQALALARARLFEQLAQDVGEAAPEHLYLLGLASLLPQLLHSTAADALAGLHLPDDARQALCDGSGPWVAYLSLARALEQSDTPAAERLAADFGGLPRVLAVSARCWG